MKSKLYLLVFLISGQQLMAQIPEDALRMSWNVPSGTARHQAIGGAMGSLGGDLTSLYVNPAGLGFFKTNEFVLSPGFGFYKGKGNFRGEGASSDQLSRFGLGTSGFVFGWSDRYSKWASSAFGIAVNRTANFNNTTHYKGTNDYSSFSEPMANSFFNYYLDRKERDPNISDADIIDDALDEPGLSLLTKMGLHTFLIDTRPKAGGGGSDVISRAEEALVVNQEYISETTGGITEIAFGLASNMDDKFYIGGSLGVPIVNYKRVSEFTESDANGSGNNEFNYSRYRETYTSKGVGVNVKLGLIFKPAEFLRLGLAIHTPTFYGLKDKFSSNMTTDIDTTSGNPKVFDVNSSVFFNGTDPSFKYDLRSPWRFMLSGSYVFREAEDVSQQRGFVTADIEYVSYKGQKLSSGEDSDDGEYFSDVNKAIKAIYKPALNFRVGGELKFNTLMTRLGFAYYGSPYDDKALKGRKMNISGGLGYRDKGIFVDLTYVHTLNKDVHFPYRVDEPRLNTFADLRESSGNVLLTVGFKF